MSSPATLADASIPDSVNDARLKGETPWTGEAAPKAVDAASVVGTLATGAGVGARTLLPERPWGNPRLRFAFWLGASLILVVVAIVLIFVSGVASIPVWVVAIVAVARAFRGAYVSELEQRIERRPRVGRTAKVDSPSNPGDGPADGTAQGGGSVAAT